MLAEDNGADVDPVEAIAGEYQRRTGIPPRVIAGTSPGARQWGVRVLGC
jgi:hypothetical protein